MPVSELEKKAERKMSAARMEKSRPSEASFNAGVNLCYALVAYLEEKPAAGQGLSAAISALLEYQFQHQLCAEKGQHQQAEASEGKPYRSGAAPAQLVMAPQQHSQ